MRANGSWTPDLVASAVKWMQMSEETIRNVPGPAYPGDGRIDLTVVARQQDFWHQRGLVNALVSPAAIVDTTILHDAESLRGRGSK